MAGNKIIAVDLGGTNLRTALIENNKIIEIIKKKTSKEKNLLIKEMSDSIEYFVKKEKNIKGIGISSAGPLDSKKGIIKNPPNLPLKNFNFKKYFEKKFKLKVVVENDANCVAVAEARLGCKKNNFFILTLGTGIGGGIFINGKLYDGEGFGGELGHIVLNDGKDFEFYWKEKTSESIKYYGKKLLIKELFELKDKNAEKILDDIVEYLGQGIGSLINVFDPEIVVLAGGAKETGNKFLRLIKNSVKKYVILPKKTEIIWSPLNEPGLLGASLLIK